MNTTVFLKGEWTLVLLLAAEAGLAAGFLAAALRWARSAVWGRTFCQVAILALLALALGEISGAARQMAQWARHPAVEGHIRAGQPISRRPASPPAARATVPPPAVYDARLTAEEAARLALERIIKPGLQAATLASGSSLRGQDGPAGNRKSPVDADWLGLIWAAGALVVVGRSVLGRGLLVVLSRRCSPVRDFELRQRVHRLAEALRMRRRVRLIESIRLAGPIAFGWIRPTVALPPGMARELNGARGDAVLLHELAHLAWHDPFWCLLADAAAALLWWHPAVWWVRRRLLLANELAADEASLLVAGGPQALAECLVALGARLVQPPLPGRLGMAGFRSHLGRRVQRLLGLEGGAWSPPRRLPFLLARSFGPVALMAIPIWCSAWVMPQASNEGASMKTMLRNWKHSLAAFGVLAAVHTPALAADPAATNKPAGPAAAVSNTAPADAPALSPGASSTLTGSGSSSWFIRPGGNHGAKVAAALDRIVMPTAGVWNNLPLTEVAKILYEECRRRDPEGEGVNFLFKPDQPGETMDPATGLPKPVQHGEAINPATGLPERTAEARDLWAVSIRIDPALRQVTMRELLDAIVEVASAPIAYSVEDYGVVIGFKSDMPSAAKAPAEPLSVRTYKIERHSLASGMEEVFGIKIKTAVPGPTTGATPQELQAALKKLLARLGVLMSGDKFVFYNEQNGVLMMRGTPADLQTVGAAIETLSGLDSKPAQGSSREEGQSGRQIATGKVYVPKRTVSF